MNTLKKIKDWRGNFDVTPTVRLLTDTHYEFETPYNGESRPDKNKSNMVIVPNENEILLRTDSKTIDNAYIETTGKNEIIFNTDRILAFDTINYRIRFRTLFADSSWFHFSYDAFCIILEKIGEKPF